MPKRFVDTEIWQKDWFLNLSDTDKLLTKFIFDNCDCAGIYEISWRMLKVFFTSEITKENFKRIKQIKFLDDNTVFVEDFVLFQCGISSLNELNANNNAHKGIIKRLIKYNLFSLGANEPLTSPSIGALCGAQEKEKEKEKEMYKEKNNQNMDLKEKEKEKKEKEKFFDDLTESDPYMSNKVSTFMQIFSKEFHKSKNCISREERIRLTNVLNDLAFQGYSIEEIAQTICENLKNTKFKQTDMTFNPGINWLLKDDARNFYVTLNGQFVQQTTEGENGWEL